MIIVAQGLHGDARLWFDRAVAVEMDYMPAYTAMFNALRPMWGGSYGAMYKFGLECAETKRFDTDVPVVLISVLNSIGRNQGRPDDVWRRRGVYENVKRVLEGVRATRRTPTTWARRLQPGARWALSLGAVVAIHVGRYDDARQFLDRARQSRSPLALPGPGPQLSGRRGAGLRPERQRPRGGGPLRRTS